MHCKKQVLIIVSLLLLCRIGGRSQQTARIITSSVSPDSTIGFLEFRPANYGKELHPLIIFLHGWGERGNGRSEIQWVASNGIPRYCAAGASMRFAADGKTASFVVLSPQLNRQYGAWPVYYVEAMLRYAKANLHIDTNRIYLTGMSLGGGGVWAAITASPQLAASFAAVATVCGTQETNDGNFKATVVQNHLPIWAFHAMDDKTVRVENTQHAEVLASIAGLQPAIKITYYQRAGHAGTWQNAYDTGHITRKLNNGKLFTAKPNLYEWFLLHRRATTAGQYRQ